MRPTTARSTWPRRRDHNDARDRYMQGPLQPGRGRQLQRSDRSDVSDHGDEDQPDDQRDDRGAGGCGLQQLVPRGRDAAITMTRGIATCRDHYNQAGDDNYNAATEVTSATTATKINQTINVTTAAPADAAYNSSFHVAATPRSQ